MAKASFTNEQLVKAWAKAAANEGTRGDVVADLMGQMGQDATDKEAYRKVYNNVTQRVKQLSNHATSPLKFKELKAGQKGARRTDADMASLQALMDAEGEDAPETSGE